MNVKNITLTGEEVRVEVLGQNCDVKNDGEETIFISNRPNIIEGADGVMPLHPHEAAKYFDVRGIVYVKGTGKVVLVGNNEYNGLVFRSAAAAGGVDTAAREEIADVNEKVDVLNSRINNLSSLGEGSTTGDAELMDIRVGADGTIYPNAGEAVRKQVGELKENISNLYKIEDLGFIVDSVGTTTGNYYVGYANAIKPHGRFNIVSAMLRIKQDCQLTCAVYDSSFSEIIEQKSIWGKVNGISEYTFELDNIVDKNETIYIAIYSNDRYIEWFQSTGNWGALHTNDGTLNYYNPGTGWKHYGGVGTFDMLLHTKLKTPKIISLTEQTVKMNYVHVSTTGNDVFGNGTKEFPYKTLFKANDSIRDNGYYNRYTIVVASGTYYDLQNKYAASTPTGLEGITTKDYVYYQSENPSNPEACVIVWDGTHGYNGSISYQNVALYKCPFHILNNSPTSGMHTSISGFKFVLKNLRYALHVETKGYGRNVEWSVENCIFEWGGVPDCTGNNVYDIALGFGNSQFENGIMESCKIVLTGTGRDSVLNHDWDWRYDHTPAVKSGCKLTFKNCDFGGGNVTFRNMFGDDATDTFGIVEIINCKNILTLQSLVMGSSTKCMYRFNVQASQIIANRVTDYMV